MKYTTASCQHNSDAFRVSRKFAWLPIIVQTETIDRKYDDPVLQKTFVWLGTYYLVNVPDFYPYKFAGANLEDALHEVFRYERLNIDKCIKYNYTYRLQKMLMCCEKYINTLICNPKADADIILPILKQYRDMAIEAISKIDKTRCDGGLQ